MKLARDAQAASGTMSRGLVVLFTLAGAAAVGNLYWAQPLLAMIAQSFNLPVTQSGIFITVTQLGYAAGVLLLMPLGDALNRRIFIPALISLSALALLGCALAPDSIMLKYALTLVGMTSLGGQLLLPLAGDLARNEEKGRVIGTIASGMLIGSMLSRLLGGVVADNLGWRATYMAAAAIDVLFATILLVRLPDDRRTEKIAYFNLLRSVFSAVGNSRTVRVTMVIGACAFAVFTMFWTGMTFLLSSDPFFYTPTQIGMLNVIGLAGAFCARNAGKYNDAGRSTQVTGFSLALLLVSLLLAGVSSTSLILIGVTTLMFSFAMQGVFVLSQARLLTISPALRSRLNAAYVVCCFIAGAGGSALAGRLWQAGGWSTLLAGEAGVIVIALLSWMLFRRTLQAAELA